LNDVVPPGEIVQYVGLIVRPIHCKDTQCSTTVFSHRAFLVIVSVFLDHHNTTFLDVWPVAGSRRGATSGLILLSPVGTCGACPFDRFICVGLCMGGQTCFMVNTCAKITAQQITTIPTIGTAIVVVVHGRQQQCVVVSFRFSVGTSIQCFSFCAFRVVRVGTYTWWLCWLYQ